MSEALPRLQAEIFSRLDAGTTEDVREASRLCAILPEPTPDTQTHIDHALVCTAFALEQQGDMDSAVAFYSRLMNCESADPEPRSNASYRYGIIREVQGVEAESIAAYELAIAITPLPLIARVARQRLSGLLLRAGRFEEALPYIEYLVADPGLEEPERIVHRLQRLRALLKTCRFNAQHENWLAILPAAGLIAEDYLAGLWAEVAMELELAQQHEAARDFYLRLLEMEGVSNHTRINAHFRLGLVYESLTDWNNSLRHYQLAVDAPLEFPEAQVHARFCLGALLYLSEDYEMAVEHLALLRFAPEITPQQRMEAHLRLGICLLRLGRLEEAQREFESCRERAGNTDVKSDLCLAEIFELRRDLTAARACYERAIASPGADPLTKAAALTRLHQLR
jgi:tetratricopeptide (TPR) repeat protein